MKAVGLYKYLPIEDSQSLVDLDIPQPNHPITGHDLLVAINAISVNPVDTKVRKGLIPSPHSYWSSKSCNSNCVKLIHQKSISIYSCALF